MEKFVTTPSLSLLPLQPCTGGSCLTGLTLCHVNHARQQTDTDCQFFQLCQMSVNEQHVHHLLAMTVTWLVNWFTQKHCGSKHLFPHSFHRPHSSMTPITAEHILYYRWPAALARSVLRVPSTTASSASATSMVFPPASSASSTPPAST